MNVSLTSELERYVASKVESGLYHSASEVIRDGLRLLRERDELHRARIEELRGEIRIGLDQADRGQVSPFNDTTLAEIKENGKRRRAASRRAEDR